MDRIGWTGYLWREGTECVGQGSGERQGGARVRDGGRCLSDEEVNGRSPENVALLHQGRAWHKAGVVMILRVCWGSWGRYRVLGAPRTNTCGVRSGPEPGMP